MDTFPVRQGTALPLVAQLVDDQGDPITAYAGTEALAASVSGGNRLAAACTPSAAWLSGPDGTISLLVSAAQTAALAQGRWRGRLDVQDPTLGWLEAYAWALDVLPAPGTESIAPAYATLPDLFDFAGDWLADLQGDRHEAGFARQCGRARAWLDELIVGAYQPGFPAGLGDPGFGSWRAGGQYPSTWLRQQLAAGALIVSGPVLEITAKKALAYICEGQVGTDEKAGAFARLGRHFHREASGLARTLRAEVDADGDGTAEVVVNLGVGSLR